MNELVIIGKDLNQEEVTRSLNKCLVDDFASHFNDDFQDDWPV